MIRLLVSDVDGTLVRNDKTLTSRAVEAVRTLGDAGIRFAITSSRPPRGLEMLVEPLELSAPLGALSGSVIVEPNLEILRQRTIPDDLVEPAATLLESFRLDVWLYRGSDWLVRDAHAPHVAREARTVAFAPTVVEDFTGMDDAVAKIMGVSDDHTAVAAADAAIREAYGERVAVARSHPYYLDVTDLHADKGAVVSYLSERFGLGPDEVATIGDQPTDLTMFARSGVSIAMGNADPEVQRAATHVTSSNEDEGFATAVERFILRQGG